MLFSNLIFLVGTSLAAVSVTDPSDIISPSLWAADNAIIPDYNVSFISVQPNPIVAAYTVTNSASISYETLSTALNQTSVLLVTGELNLTYSTVIKSGYASNLLESSFYGFNAAINVVCFPSRFNGEANDQANGSTGNFDNVNVTVHNGAANIYVYGTGSVVHVDNAWLYSSGPVSHGVYASGNGTAYVSNVQHFSGGKRSSSFSGDSPAGYLHISDSVAHAAGIGSATFYALGEIYATNVVALSENGPTVFMDGAQKAYLTNCETTAGLLGGVAIFSSSTRESGAILSLDNSKITTLGPIPGLWFGNVIIDVSLHASELVTSGVLVVANYSQITQDFDYYADYSQQPNLQPAEVYVNVTESTLVGDLVAYNSSLISWSLSKSSWMGTAYSGFGEAYFDVHLDNSTWTLTNSTMVQNLTDTDGSLSGIESQGFDVYYNASALLNEYLGGKTIALSGGGNAIPI
ncbi:uncharacterized protein LY89DRAFT_755618 [Mollisia scopiformis]|uniref:Uncharacterized protein n=1 Tax=Mollisia scopiformis TaxID=149040 RepID=A0A194XTX3_MOLSC|nr:uncharacterized protein LY89DRAFT_755618 [Mollisia scopiformis]KUJ23658.1 hypothetical protein LY89DRAFT_755618 [Mollisia scopiformis]